jgi:hypothetical protein
MLLMLLCGTLPCVAATRTVTSLADDGSTGTLRSTLATANSGDTIAFNVTGTIILTQDALEVNKDLTVSGPGADVLKIIGGQNFVIFQIDAGTTATILGLTLQEPGGGGVGNIINSGNLTVSNSTFLLAVANTSVPQAGGILNTGTLSVTSCSFVGSLNGGIAQYGGGILNQGTATVASSTFSFLNVTGYGGAIYNALRSTITITNSTFYDNQANSGGAIFNNGSFFVVAAAVTAGSNCKRH